MNSRLSKQLLFNSVFGIFTILFCILIISQNKLNLNKETIQSLSNIKEIAATIFNSMIGKDNLFFRIIGAIFAFIFIFFIPIISSVFCILTQVLSFFLHKKEKKWRELFGNSFTNTSFNLSVLTLNSLLFSLIFGFYCNRILILFNFLINLVHVLVSIVFIRNKNENININFCEYKEKLLKGQDDKNVKRKENMKNKKDKSLDTKKSNIIQEKKKVSSIGNIIDEELIAPETNFIDIIDCDYRCPDCNEKLDELIDGGITLHCNKCNKTYKKDDYRFNTNN